MKNWLRYWVREFRGTISIIRKAMELPGLKPKIQALLYISIQRENRAGERIIACVRGLHEAWLKPVDGLISLPVKLNGQNKVFYLRKGNFGDYRVAGEMLDNVYRKPAFMPKVIYDCGANIGVFSLFAGVCFPGAKIVCFEPDQNNLPLLRKNLAANGITADIREAGIWDRKCKLYYHPSRSTIEGTTNEEPSPFPVPVECLELDDPDVWVKMDVEGAEYRVLPILLRSKPLPRYMSIELHFFNTRGSEIMDLFKSAGYTLHGYFDSQNICAVFDAERS